MATYNLIVRTDTYGAEELDTFPTYKEAQAALISELNEENPGRDYDQLKKENVSYYIDEE